MANRCFSRPVHSTNKSSSDYTSSKRQRIQYENLVENVKKNNITESKNGTQYNTNVKLVSCGETNRPRLAAVNSYDTLLDITKGRYLERPDPITAENISKGHWASQWGIMSYTTAPVTLLDFSWKGYDLSLSNVVPYPQLSLNPANPAHTSTIPSGTHIGSTLTTVKNYPGYVLDASNTIFNSSCGKAGWENKVVPMANVHIKPSHLHGIEYPTTLQIIDASCTTNPLPTYKTANIPFPFTVSHGL
tara:strand:- start:614 stop:1351 length:738 start_codon:yes stop_codon:yes gene_type:complete